MNLTNKKIKIAGNRIYLKTLEEKDASQKYCDWLNDPEVNKYLETKKATNESLKRYINEKFSSSICVFCGIFTKEGDIHIGNVKLEPIAFKQKNATFGILIGDKNYWGKGFGTEATKIFVDWAFNELDLNEINLGVIADNIAAVKVYEKVGFKISSIKMKIRK